MGIWIAVILLLYKEDKRLVIKEGRNERLFNAIYLTDRQGLSVAMSAPVSGNHNDLFDIEAQFQEVVSTLEETEISVDGLFINAMQVLTLKSLGINVRPKAFLPIFALINAMEILIQK